MKEKKVKATIFFTFGNSLQTRQSDSLHIYRPVVTILRLVQLHFPLRRTPPKPGTIKPVTHLHVEIDGDGGILAGNLLSVRLKSMAVPIIIIESRSVHNLIGLCKHSILLLDQPLSLLLLLLLQSFSTQTNGNLIHSQNHQIHDRARAAAAHRRQVRRGPPRHLPYSVVLLLPQKRQSPVHRRRPQQLSGHYDFEREGRREIQRYRERGWLDSA